MGAFREERQVLIASPFCKFAHGIGVHRIPCVEMATRQAIYGRPGAAYLDMPDDIIGANAISTRSLSRARRRTAAHGSADGSVEAALNLLENAPNGRSLSLARHGVVACRTRSAPSRAHASAVRALADGRA
jgi:2-hydroxyacyl-CoA lyase 1